MAINNIQNFNSGAQFIPTGAAQAGGAAVAAPQSGGLASPGVTNFAQNMAQDGAAIKSMGANAMGNLFGQGGQGGAPMMAPPSPGGTGYDNDRAVALLKEKIGAGETTGDDLFAAAIASSGQQ